jgi:hypothetical protein
MLAGGLAPRHPVQGSRIASNQPVWPILPAGHRRVASGTLLPVIRPILAATLFAALPAAPPTAALAAAPTMVPVASAGARHCAGTRPRAAVGEGSRSGCGVPAPVHRVGTRFVGAGARYVFVGPATGLHGPPKVVLTLANHDDHLHLRIRPGGRSGR